MSCATAAALASALRNSGSAADSTARSPTIFSRDDVCQSTRKADVVRCASSHDRQGDTIAATILTQRRIAVASTRDHFDRQSGDDSRALPVIRLPLAGAPVGGVDDDAGVERPARAVERSGGQDVRRQSSLRSLSRRRDGEEIGEEVRAAINNREAGSYLHDSHADLAAAVGAVYLRGKFLCHSGVFSISAGASSAIARGLAETR